MSKKKYVKPELISEEFVPQEYVAACYSYVASKGDVGGIVYDKVGYKVTDSYNITYPYFQIGTVNQNCGPKTAEEVSYMRPVFFTRSTEGNYQRGDTMFLRVADAYDNKVGYTDWAGQSVDLNKSVCFFTKVKVEEKNNS